MIVADLEYIPVYPQLEMGFLFGCSCFFVFGFCCCCIGGRSAGFGGLGFCCCLLVVFLYMHYLKRNIDIGFQLSFYH